jgi:phenylalanyl-tRNA synthetase alpha chain
MSQTLDVEALHPLEIKVLLAFDGKDNAVLGLRELGSRSGLDPSRIRRALEWLLTRDALSVVSEATNRFLSITDVGREHSTRKIPELRILNAAESGITMEALKNADLLNPDEIGPAVGSLKKHGLLGFAKGGLLTVNPDRDISELEQLQAVVDKYAGLGLVAYDAVSEADQPEFESLLGPITYMTIPEDEKAGIESLSRKRGKAKGVFRISESTIRRYQLTDMGRKLFDAVSARGMTGEEISLVTPDHLKNGAWRDVQFRRYSLDLKPPRQVVGKRNPYRNFLDFVKVKLVSLGFEEMTGDHVEPEFWNMDALFMPQFHSARDIHDVYFVKDPTHAKRIEEPYFSDVAATHHHGGETGSKGWGYDFDMERSRQLVLRSQTTVLSARWLHKAKVPGKYFAMARCFRYDDVDATHSADFFQIEGIVLAKENTFCTLLGLLKLFAKEVAKADEIKFVPGYFPFTEPSVEAHIKHPKLGWIEMGGAGIFRPEVTQPHGVDVPVIAWGLGVDRMAMVALGIQDIRDLFATDLNCIRTARVKVDL